MDGKQRTGGVGFRIDAMEPRSDGALDVRGNLTKTGVFEYQRGDTTVRELRSDAEVFSEDALDSLRGSFVTVDHPAGFLEVDGWRDTAVGVVSQVKVEPPYVSGSMRIWDSTTIHRIQKGYLKEVSCGYSCIPQEVDREDAEVEQTHLRFNHVAIGPEKWGRLGSDVSLRLDSNGQEVITPFEANHKETNMDEIKEAIQPVLDAIKGLEAKYDSLSEVVAAQTPEPTEDSPIVKHQELPDTEKVDAMVREQVDSALKLELEARDAYAAFFPDDYIKPELCGLKLCEAVLHTVDANRVIKEDDQLPPLVREAQLLAKKERMDALSAKPTVASIQQQLTGTAARVLSTPVSIIDGANVFGHSEDN